jgi:hypothetical protein
MRRIFSRGMSESIAAMWVLGIFDTLFSACCDPTNIL